MSQSLTVYTRDPTTGRIVRRRASSGTILLLDTSGSMIIADGSDEKRRIDVLATVLVDVLMGVQLQACATFDSNVTEIPLTGDISLPEPSGSTQMHAAMQWALQQPEQPKRVVILSDGDPDDRLACQEHAATMKAKGIVLDCYYCGPPRDRSAREFLETLATSTGGRSGQFQLITSEAKAASDALILRIGHDK